MCDTLPRPGQRETAAPFQSQLHPRLVGLRLHRIAAQGVDVVVESLFQMDQAALASAVRPVLQGGDRKGIRRIHERGNLLPHPRDFIDMMESATQRQIEP